MKLHVADNLSLPLEATTQTFAVLAKRGAGKTYLASVLAEELLKASQQIVAIDPTGAWHGLRSGFAIPIFGGDHGDLPLEEHSGEVIASAIVQNGFSAVLDLSLFRKGQLIRFMVAFAESLYRLNREPLHLFVDEADAMAPQGRSFGGEENRMLGAMEDIVRRGRKRGIGCTLISQRPAILNKNVLTQAESLFALRLTHPRDIDAVMEWINVHAEPAQAKEVVESLPSLSIGEGWFWSPGWLGVLKRIQVRQRETFDSSATPRPGEKVKAPKTMAQVDLDALGEQIKATVVKAKENDPRELKRRLAEMEKQLKAKPTTEADPEALERARQLGHRDAVQEWASERTQLQRDLAHARDTLHRIDGLVAASRISAPPQPERKPLPAHRQEPVSEKRDRIIPKNIPRETNGEVVAVGRGGLRRILVALAQKSGLTNRQIGLRARLSSQSGTFGTYMGIARSNGWIRDEGERRYITDEGLAALGTFEPLPEGPELLNYWLNKLGQSGAARMLQALAESYPSGLTNEEIGERAGISHTSGTFGTYLGKLRGLELVEGRGTVFASEELFA